MDAMKIANSIPMWLACALPVAFVILQAVLFARGAYKSGKKLGLNDKQMKKAMKSSAVTSIGPSIGVFSAMCASHLSKPFYSMMMKADQITMSGAWKNALACVLGAVIMFVLTKVANKKEIGWLKEWSLTITILGAMIITALV